MTERLHFAAPGPAGGPLFWATGDWYPSEIRQALADYRLLAAAVEREWPKEWP